MTSARSLTPCLFLLPRRLSHAIKISEAIRATVNAMRVCCGDDAVNAMLQVSERRG